MHRRGVEDTPSHVIDADTEYVHPLQSPSDASVIENDEVYQHTQPVIAFVHV